MNIVYKFITNREIKSWTHDELNLFVAKYCSFNIHQRNYIYRTKKDRIKINYVYRCVLKELSKRKELESLSKSGCKY